MSLVALRCPSCSAALPAAPQRRIFACPNGHGAFRAGQGRLWPLPLQRVDAVQSLPPEGEIVLLPIWVLPVDPLWQREGRLPKELRVPALGVQRLPRVLELARNLSRSPAPWLEARADGLDFDGAELDCADAMEIGEFVALSLRAGWLPDGEAADFTLGFDTGRLALLPAWRFAGRLEDLVCGVSCAASLFDDCGLRDRRHDWLGTTSAIRR